MKFLTDGDRAIARQSVTRLSTWKAVELVKIWHRQLKSGWEKKFVKAYKVRSVLSFHNLKRGDIIELEFYIKIALDLGRSAEGQTSRNISADSVTLKDGQIIGTGVHLKAGTPYAEMHTLTMIGAKFYGAELYEMLEPCAYTGKTSPCTGSVILNVIRRVFIAPIDPFTSVIGRDIELLKAGRL